MNNNTVMQVVVGLKTTFSNPATKKWSDLEHFDNVIALQRILEHWVSNLTSNASSFTQVALTGLFAAGSPDHNSIVKAVAKRSPLLSISINNPFYDHPCTWNITVIEYGLEVAIQPMPLIDYFDFRSEIQEYIYNYAALSGLLVEEHDNSTHISIDFKIGFGEKYQEVLNQIYKIENQQTSLELSSQKDIRTLLSAPTIQEICTYASSASYQNWQKQVQKKLNSDKVSFGDLHDLLAGGEVEKGWRALVKDLVPHINSKSASRLTKDLIANSLRYRAVNIEHLNAKKLQDQYAEFRRNKGKSRFYMVEQPYFNLMDAEQDPYTLGQLVRLCSQVYFL